MATLTVYPQAGSGGSNVTVDGTAGRNSVSEDWATIIAGAGNTSAATFSIDYAALFVATTTTNQWVWVNRGIFTFDTSALTSGATISAATMSLYGQSKANQSSSAIKINIFLATPASNNALVNGDYGQVGSTAQCDTAIAYASFSTSAYNDFALNATGISNISKTGITKFGTRESAFDATGVAPTWVSGANDYFVSYMADQTGTTNDPKLVITYTSTGVSTALNFLTLLNVG